MTISIPLMRALTVAFQDSYDRLIIFCYDSPHFRPIYDGLTAQHPKDVGELVFLMLRQAGQDEQKINQLSTLLRKYSPTIYDKYLPQPVSAKIAFDWVTIPAGQFIMGSKTYDDTKPIHNVYLPEYKIARVPVTNEQWEIFLNGSGYQWANYNRLWQNGLPHGKEKHPIVYVCWDDVIAFCNWVGVRLPTEAEWEKAARGTDGRKYTWGSHMPTKELTNYKDSGIGDTTPVGNYPKGASPYGCLDMTGNVWEWCASKYSYPYKPDDGRENVSSDDNKVIRGGSWVNDSSELLCTRRRSDNGIGIHNLGFRVCLPNTHRLD